MTIKNLWKNISTKLDKTFNITNITYKNTTIDITVINNTAYLLLEKQIINKIMR